MHDTLILQEYLNAIVNWEVSFQIAKRERHAQLY